MDGKYSGANGLQVLIGSWTGVALLTIMKRVRMSPPNVTQYRLVLYDNYKAIFHATPHSRTPMDFITGS